MKVSIITATFNRKKHIKKAIRSVLTQSFQDYELVVVDDCSTDGTYEAVLKLAKQYPQIKVYRTEKNSGHDGLPKNLGIKHAQGDYALFLDDDDELRPDALKILHKYMTHTGADVVYGDYLTCVDGKLSPGWSEDFNPAALGRGNYITQCTAMFKVSKFKEIGGYNESIPKLKDWNLWIRLQKAGASFAHVPIVVATINILEDSISTRFKVNTDSNGMYQGTFFNPADCRIYADKTCLGGFKPLKVAIFTLTWDRLEYTKTMYNAMKKLSGYEFDWFVIDQGSTDGTKDFVQDKVKDKLFNKQNTGIAEGWDSAIELIKKNGEYDIVIKVDNDAEMLSENWLNDMVSIFESNKKVILSPYVEGLEDSPGGVLRQRANESPYVMINDKVLGMVPYLGGIVWACYLELYKDFNFPKDLKGNKDYFISQYAKKQGYNPMYMEELRVSHISGTIGQHKDYPEYFKRYE